MTIKEAHKIVRDIAREKTFGLTPDKCNLFPDLTAPKHYTFVFFPDESIKNKVMQYSQELLAIDKTLALNPPEYYHSTLFHCPADRNIHSMIAKLSGMMPPQLAFAVENLVATPEGISINVCPLEMDFIYVRKELYKIAGYNFIENDRGLSSWITIARFQEPPEEELLQYFRDHFDDKIGEFSVDTIYLYESENKILEDGKLIQKFCCNQDNAT